jgi:hypothetical protein
MSFKGYFADMPEETSAFARRVFLHEAGPPLGPQADHDQLLLRADGVETRNYVINATG